MEKLLAVLAQKLKSKDEPGFTTRLALLALALTFPIAALCALATVVLLFWPG